MNNQHNAHTVILAALNNFPSPSSSDRLYTYDGNSDCPSGYADEMLDADVIGIGAGVVPTVRFTRYVNGSEERSENTGTERETAILIMRGYMTARTFLQELPLHKLANSIERVKVYPSFNKMQIWHNGVCHTRSLLEHV